MYGTHQLGVSMAGVKRNLSSNSEVQRVKQNYLLLKAVPSKKRKSQGCKVGRGTFLFLEVS